MGTLKIKVGTGYVSIPRGAKGATGPANELAIGTVTTSAPGGNASATITGTPPSQTLNLTIPRGDTGPAGASGGTPTGSVMAFAGSTAPTDYLLCDGTAVSRATYATLFGVIGTTYGVGDGSTTFNLPDLRVRVPVGAGTGKTLGATDGDAEANRNADWSHSHGHSASTGVTVNYGGGENTDPRGASYTTTGGGGHSHSTGGPSSTTQVSSGTARTPADGSHGHSISGGGHEHDYYTYHDHSQPTHFHTASGSTSVGSNGSPDHPFAVFNYIIKT